jgi:hypothetical protein
VTIKVLCSNGHALAVADEHAGRKVRCPTCQEVLRVPVAHPPEEDVDLPDPDDEPEPTPRKSSKRERRAALARVNRGLGFRYAQLLLYLIALLLFAVTLFVSNFTASSAPATRFLVLALAYLIIGVSLVTPVLGLVGSILCLWVPAASGARPYIIVSCLLDVLSVPLGIALFLLRWPSVLTAPLWVPSWILFLFFLRNLSEYLRERACAAEALQAVWHWLGLSVGMPVLIALLGAGAYFLGFVGFCLFMVVGSALMLVWLAWAIKYVVRVLDLIGSLRQVILSRT